MFKIISYVYEICIKINHELETLFLAYRHQGIILKLTTK